MVGDLKSQNTISGIEKFQVVRVERSLTEVSLRENGKGNKNQNHNEIPLHPHQNGQ